MIDYTENEKIVIRARSMNNRGAVLDSGMCGCFFCLRMFKSEEVVRWKDNDETAVCPYCSSDTVLPESDDYTLDEGMLLSMKQRWFCSSK